MTAFIVICAAMVIAALAWLTLPLWRMKDAEVAVQSRGERRVSAAVVIIAIGALAATLYPLLSNWNWDAAETAAAETTGIDAELRQLEARLADQPEDVQGWLLLGRSYAALRRYGSAADAYQRAYDLTRGENVEATIGLGEALALVDQSSLNGRAGQLIEAALAKAPNNPKALWYGAVMALQAGDLRLGRDRLNALLAQDPPEELRAILERQVQDLGQQLGDAGPAQGTGASASSGVAQAGRSLSVSVRIAPEIQEQLRQPMPLFILARDPVAPGPPLAVQRRSSAEAPLNVQLTEADAMLPTRTIAGVARVKVIARVSLSGAPQERSGDFYGEADYDFSNDTGTLQILIDRTVP